MTETNILNDLKEAVLKGDDDLAFDLAQKALDNGTAAIKIMEESIVPGIQEAGELWKRNEYFQPDIVMSAEAFRMAMEVIDPRLTSEEFSTTGKVVIGTVAGDMHTLGKLMVKAMLRSGGFEVIDIGEDTSVATFIEKVKEHDPDIVGLGCYMTTTMLEMKEVLTSLQNSGIRDKLRVMIGGVPTTQEFADEIGADAWGKDAFDAVEKAKKLMEKPLEVV
ncbi:MAG: corrinoid protein [Candidatus Lokiarchaeota archaeon]|nr:corrinoid protein [Candidatus Lokiarchaeota archaeon]